jgi:hypothetical protein
MGAIFSSCADEPPQSNPKHEYEGFDKVANQLRDQNARNSKPANDVPSPGVVQVATASVTAQGPAPDTAQAILRVIFTGSPPKRDPTHILKFVEQQEWSDTLPMRSLEAGDLLLKRGSRGAGEIYLIKQGSCEILVARDDGTELIVVTRHPGEFIRPMHLNLSPDGDYELAPFPDENANRNDSSKNGSSDDAPSSPSPRKIIAAAGSPLKIIAFAGAGAGKAISGIATLMRVKKKWGGGRRGSDVQVRAATAMQVLVLTAEQMGLALRRETGVGGEIGSSMTISKEELETKKSGELDTKKSGEEGKPKGFTTTLDEV